MNYNLDYIFKISKGDSGFIDQFWSLVKKEWPQETKEYRDLIQKGKHVAAASLVHKLKHKFVLLSATEGYELAQQHEKCLKVGSVQHVNAYEKILTDLTQFINNTNPHDL